MGNPAWGHGYHTGFSAGARQGGTIVGAVFLGAGLLVTGGKWGYDKLKDRKLAKADRIAAEMDPPADDIAADADGHN